MNTTHSTLHSCDSCNMGKNDADCASCKLSSLTTSQSNTKRKGNKEEEEDYSISERLTEKRRDNSILYLCIASFAILLLVLLFTKLFLQP